MTTANKPHMKIRIRNKKGLHARASAKFVKCAETFDAVVTVTRDDQSVTGTSIMGLLMLAAGPGTCLLIEATGPEAPEALEALEMLINDGFGEGCICEPGTSTDYPDRI
jgi:phosphocarrier protein HPr